MRSGMIYDAAIIGTGPPGGDAAGEDNIAAHSILEYLSELEKAGEK